MSLLSLPRELIERILLSLDCTSILSCSLVNKHLNFVSKASCLVQYRQACDVAGFIDNSSPECTMSYAERFDALMVREEAWEVLKPVFTTTIKVDHSPSTIYDLTGGVYLLGDANMRDLHYCRLPSSPEDVPKWVKIHGHGPDRKWSGFIVDMGMALYEHDLIVTVISSEVGSSSYTDVNRYSLDLVFLQFSTGEYHPLARHPCVHVQNSPMMRPAIAIEIVGDNLAIVVNNRHSPISDRLFIFDWKTGVRKLQHEAGENAYSSLVFISPDKIFVPNLFLSQFEIWYIPPTPSSAPYQTLALQLPKFSPGYFILNLTCRGEPNPFLSYLPHLPSHRPFFPSPYETIIIANIRVAGFPGLGEGTMFTLLLHRLGILSAVLRDIPSPPPSDMKYQTNLADVSIGGAGDEQEGSGGCTVFSKIAQPVFQELHVPLGNQGMFTAPSAAPSTPVKTQIEYSIPLIPWASWGNRVTRWYYSDESQTRWITTSAGHRCAFLESEDVEAELSKLTVVDFNERNFNNLEKLGEGWRSKLVGHIEYTEDKDVEPSGAWLRLDHFNVFVEEVTMGLPSLVFGAPGVYDFDGLLMDEERLLGLKVTDTGRVESITVLYFG